MTENERLTIDEIIQHCNRNCEMHEFTAIVKGQTREDITSKGYWEHYQVANYLEELKQYREIGTIEEFKALKEDKKFLEFLYNHILPNEMEQYLSMYHTKDKVAVNGYADQSGLMSAT